MGGSEERNYYIMKSKILYAGSKEIIPVNLFLNLISGRKKRDQGE